MRGRVRTGNGPVLLGPGTDIGPFALSGFRFVPIRKRCQFLDCFGLNLGTIYADTAEGSLETSLEQVQFGSHLVHDVADLALMLRDERVLHTSGQAAPGLAQTVAQLVHEWTTVDAGVTRQPQEFFLAAFYETFAGSRAEMPADEHLVEVDALAAQSPHEHPPEHAAARSQNRFIRGPDDLLAQGAEKVVVVGPRHPEPAPE